MEEKRRMEKLYADVNGCYARGCYRSDKRNGHLVRWYPYSSSHANNKKWWCKYSNRKFRRARWKGEEETDILNRGYHKKKFDLWWTLY